MAHEQSDGDSDLLMPGRASTVLASLSVACFSVAAVIAIAGITGWAGLGYSGAFIYSITGAVVLGCAGAVIAIMNLGSVSKTRSIVELCLTTGAFLGGVVLFVGFLLIT